jgi:PHD/YefM family antitoxin component YafN of YafNO toxin-antitoxin module
MMLDLTRLKLQYVTNETGEKEAVILPIEEFNELVEDLEDLVVIAERQDEATIPFNQVIDELKKDGRL